MLNNDHVKRLYFIGDIHAQYNKLLKLLKHLDFDIDDLESNTGDAQLVFIGNLIDSEAGFAGDHLNLLRLIKRLVDNNYAYCLLGNHEFNAIGWATKLKTGQWARPHSAHNFKQHQCFLEAVGEGSEQHSYWINWFKTLPFFIEFESVRAIHACWDESVLKAIAPYLNENHSLKEAFWQNAFDPDHELFGLCETLLKGPEYPLAKGEFYFDKSGEKRTKKRSQWWQFYDLQDNTSPVIIGHYTLSGLPQAKSKNVVCVDYNAAKAEQPLVSYQVSLPAHDQQYEFADKRYFRYVDQPDLEDLTNQGLIALLELQLQLFKKLQGDNFTENEQGYVEQLSDILWREWNPMALTDLDDCRDQYYAYEEGAFLFAKYGNVGLLGAYLYLSQSISIGLDIKNAKQKCAHIAWTLIEKAKDAGINQNDHF
ncbi:MAG: metallophosphoesterase [Psychromonas sp.]